MPKISVLMGVYNCESTIRKSIQSIINQSITDWEFIICDDGSKDKTVSIIEEIAKNEKRIVLLINEENKGLSYSLNKCIKHAKGEFCARMDGDDLCSSNRFEKQIEFLEHNLEYGFVSSTMNRFDEKGVYQDGTIDNSYSPTKMHFVKGSPFCHAPTMFRTEVYHLVDGYRDIEKTKGVEDYDLWFRLYEKGVKGYILKTPLYSMFDGRDAGKRRTFNRRINESWVRWNGYKLLNIPFVWRVYALKPIIIGFIPQWLYKMIR